MSAGALRNQIQDIMRTFQLRWISLFGKLRTKADAPDFPALMGDLAQSLGALKVDPAETLLDYARQAGQLGVEQGFRESGLDPRELTVRIPLDTHIRVAGVSTKAREKIDQARRFATTLRPGTFNQTVGHAIAPAQSAANIIDRAARTITNEQLNSGIAAVADNLDGNPVWIAERDACLTCLALSGHPIGGDGSFSDGTGFGGRPAQYAGADFSAPPAHDNCRCRITIWFGHDTAGAESITHDWAGAIADARANGDVVAEEAAHKAAAAARQSASFDLPAALRREAERSVLHGWGLPSESNRLRTRAADALLARISSRDGYSPSGWRVPTSVKKSTEGRLKKGTFGVTPFPGK